MKEHSEYKSKAVEGRQGKHYGVKIKKRSTISNSPSQMSSSWE